MEIKDFSKNTIKGVLYALVISIVFNLIFSIVMTKVDFSETVLNVIYVVISCVALVIGAVVAAKSQGSKGWMIGLAVGTIYYIALYLIYILFGGEAHLGIYEFYRFLMSIGVGTLAGMLGINL
ncbi:TIGR04086 family membrane protein [Clostridium gasigenes]|uniref:TIGR04086 family membrane protein n=1 Tax=Clostridium gasigenes TaxID=94869 RepID=UPI001C0C2BEF|nr:TIGR04086 family membrane protein [Clostridium gasigenes]MBU3106472.1 TIGR04086 family membrane protein [Clostridium gasigenes]